MYNINAYQHKIKLHAFIRDHHIPSTLFSTFTVYVRLSMFSAAHDTVLYV